MDAIGDVQRNPMRPHFDPSGRQRCNLMRYPYHILFRIFPDYIRVTALGFGAEARSRQAENLIRITESHRALWSQYHDNPALHRVLDPAADIEARPVTPEEARFVQFLILHIHLTFQLSKQGIYRQPERVREDIRLF